MFNNLQRNYKENIAASQMRDKSELAPLKRDPAANQK